MEWLFFALMAPFAWSIGSTLLKFMRINFVDKPMGYLIFTIPPVFLSLFLLFFEPFQYPGLANSLILFLSGILAFFAYYLFVYSLHEEEVSVVTTIQQGATPLFVLLLASLFLKEILSFKDYLAFFLILTGTVLISFKKNKFRPDKGILIVLLFCFMFAIHGVLLKYVSDTNFPTMMIIREAGILVIASLLFIFSKKARTQTIQTAKRLKYKKGTVAYITEIFGMTAMVLSYLAIQKAPVSLVSLIGGFQMLFVIIIAVILSSFYPRILKEGIDKKTISIKIISALLMLTGLYLISF